MNVKKSSTQEPLAGNALLFGMEHPWGKEFQIHLNEVPRVIYAPQGLKLLHSDI